jgi:hypothetical protein
MKPSDLARIVVDSTVQPKAVMFPTDAKLLNQARERLMRLAKKVGVSAKLAPADIRARFARPRNGLLTAEVICWCERVNLETRTCSSFPVGRGCWLPPS